LADGADHLVKPLRADPWTLLVSVMSRSVGVATSRLAIWDGRNGALAGTQLAAVELPEDQEPATTL
jgi:hypothetical protein